MLYLQRILVAKVRLLHVQLLLLKVGPQLVVLVELLRVLVFLLVEVLFKLVPGLVVQGLFEHHVLCPAIENLRLKALLLGLDVNQTLLLKLHYFLVLHLDYRLIRLLVGPVRLRMPREGLPAEFPLFRCYLPFVQVVGHRYFLLHEVKDYSLNLLGGRPLRVFLLLLRYLADVHLFLFYKLALVVYLVVVVVLEGHIPASRKGLVVFGVVADTAVDYAVVSVDVELDSLFPDELDSFNKPVHVTSGVVLDDALPPVDLDELLPVTAVARLVLLHGLEFHREPSYNLQFV